jgi:hypothetical protein
MINNGSVAPLGAETGPLTVNRRDNDYWERVTFLTRPERTEQL